MGDCGLTGRKIIVDTYGGMARHGGGAFSGKDPTRSTARPPTPRAGWRRTSSRPGFAQRCEVQVAYAIGVAHPVSVMVDTFGTEKRGPAQIAEWVDETSTCAPRPSSRCSTCAGRSTRRPPRTAISAATIPTSPGRTPTSAGALGESALPPGHRLRDEVIEHGSASRPSAAQVEGTLAHARRAPPIRSPSDEAGARRSSTTPCPRSPAALGRACPLGPRTVLGVMVGREPATHGAARPAARGGGRPRGRPTCSSWPLWMARYYLAPPGRVLRLVLAFGADGALRRGRTAPGRSGAPPAPPRALVARATPASRGSGPLRRCRGARRRRRAPAAAELVPRGRAPRRRRCGDGGSRAPAPEARAADRSGLDRGGPARLPRRARSSTGDQAAAVAAWRPAGGRRGLLLHGVTGSGKTEVYLRAIAARWRAAAGALVLVPEIALTPQLLGGLRARFGRARGGVALGSRAGERAPRHRRVRRAGPTWCWAPAAPSSRRSALGLVIVDEEHDSSYKQDPTRATTRARWPSGVPARRARPWCTEARRRVPRRGARSRG